MSITYFGSVDGLWFGDAAILITALSSASRQQIRENPTEVIRSFSFRDSDSVSGVRSAASLQQDFGNGIVHETPLDGFSGKAMRKKRPVKPIVQLIFQCPDQVFNGKDKLRQRLADRSIIFRCRDAVSN
jgi:hypothetical protein